LLHGRWRRRHVIGRFRDGADTAAQKDRGEGTILPQLDIPAFASSRLAAKWAAITNAAPRTVPASDGRSLTARSNPGSAPG